jgi:hypothetical protein
MGKVAKRPDKKTTPPGPKAVVLKIEGNWKTAIKKAFAKKKPEDGWPK